MTETMKSVEGGEKVEAMSPLPKNDPALVAWEAYKASPEYQNTRRWASHDDHVDGSLWAAFLQGRQSAPSAQPKPLERGELAEAVDWLALEAANLERSGARTYSGDGVDVALAASAVRIDRDRAAKYRTILAALATQEQGEPVAVDGQALAGGIVYRTAVDGERHLVEPSGFVRVKLPYDYRFTDNATQYANAERIAAALYTHPVQESRGEAPELAGLAEDLEGLESDLVHRGDEVGAATCRRVAKALAALQGTPQASGGE